MSAPESVNGAAAPTIRRLPLPGAEPPDADALRALHAAGAHFVLCRAHDEGTKKAKSALQRGWQTAAPLLDAVIEHRGRGGLVGMMPGSIGAVVVDLDPEGADNTTPPLGAPVLQHATRRAGGVHFWYKAPDGVVINNRKWARVPRGRHAGDVRGGRGYVILWNPGAVAAAVIGDDFAMADPVDPSTLPWPKKNKGNDVEQMLAASVGERNDLFNKLAFARAINGKETLTLAAAAIEAGLPDAEVAATIRSAEEGAARAKADTARAIAGATTSEADLGAEYMKIHQGNRLHRSDDLWFWWADNAGWTLDPGARWGNRPKSARQAIGGAPVVSPPPVPAIEIETLQTLHLSQPVELGDGEDSEHVRAVVAAIHEGRRDGRRELQRERRAIIEGNKWRTGNADRLRAIERALADLSASESSEPRG